MKLHELRPPAGSRHRVKRVGRGPGSGHGQTSGKGEKGQLARSGSGQRPYFEGGQLPLHRRVPKRGFTNIFRSEYRTVNVDRHNVFPAGAVVTPETLLESGVLRKGDAPVKILGNGELKVALTVRAHKYAGAATRKIEAAGGKAEILAATAGGGKQGR